MVSALTLTMSCPVGLFIFYTTGWSLEGVLLNGGGGIYRL